MPRTLDLINKLCKFSPRQGENEISAAKFIESIIAGSKMNYETQIFETRVPTIIKAELFLDGSSVPCLGSSFESGEITKPDQIKISPHSDYIETIDYSQTPSLTISRTYKKQLSQSNSISGQVMVQKLSYLSRNFLVGNPTKPKKIFIAHYDCLGGGAIDNAGGVSVLLDLVITNPTLLRDHLYLFAGNEELSYDHPVYWGHGYRQFEQKYLDFLENCQEIIVVDGIGLTEVVEIVDDLDDFFPINNLGKYKNKTKVLSSLQTEVLKCYHCLEDTPDKLSWKYLNSAYNLLLQLSK